MSTASEIAEVRIYVADTDSATYRLTDDFISDKIDSGGVKSAIIECLSVILMQVTLELSRNASDRESETWHSLASQKAVIEALVQKLKKELS